MSFGLATKGSLGHLSGWDSVSDNMKEITSTKLRKYIATVCQAAALTEVDVDWLVHHLGHESTTELAKVSKLLTAIDSGNIRGVVGKSLAEMSVEGTSK